MTSAPNFVYTTGCRALTGRDAAPVCSYKARRKTRETRPRCAFERYPTGFPHHPHSCTLFHAAWVGAPPSQGSRAVHAKLRMLRQPGLVVSPGAGRSLRACQLEEPTPCVPKAEGAFLTILLYATFAHCYARKQLLSTSCSGWMMNNEANRANWHRTPERRKPWHV